MLPTSKDSRRYDVLALLAGMLLVTAYAPFDFLPSAFVALLGLLWVLQDITPRRALWRGFLFGLGLFGAGTSWVVISIHEFGHTPLPLAVLLTILMVAYLAVYPALFGYLLVRLRVNEHPLALLVLAPALWSALEWLRGVLFTGFPWLNIGYTQVDTWLAGYAPILGVYGIGFLLMLSVCAVGTFRFHRVTALVLLLASWSGGWQLSKQEWAVAAGKPLEVTLLQGNVDQNDKFRPEKRAETMTRYEELTLENLDSDIIVWPETAIPAFYHQVADNYVTDILKETRKAGVELLTGVPIKQKGGEGQRPRYYNSAVVLGEEFGVYHKQHLVPFGEFVPFGNLLRSIGGIFNVPLSDFSSGGRQPPLAIAGQKAAVSICYEIVFGEELAPVAREATMLVNISNDAWFGDSLAPHQHFSMARMRVKETARPLLRATNTGITALVDQRGNVTRQVPSFSVQVLRGPLQPTTGETPYMRYGNLPVLVLVCLLLLPGGLLLWREGNR